MSHGILKCKECDKIIMRCRCIKHDNDITYEVCNVCKRKQDKKK